MTTPHPDCICQAKQLDRADLADMYAAEKYAEINAAFNAGRFNFNTDTN